MFYGLLLEGVNSQEQHEQLQAIRPGIDEDESWWLGMEAWVSCEITQTIQDA